MTDKLWDSHIHSSCSFDGKQNVDQLCESAFSKGMCGIAITDHCDIGPYLTSDWEERLSNSVESTKAAALKWDSRLEVSLGIELGQPLYNPELAKRVLEYASFDLVIGSIHHVRGTEDFYYLGENYEGSSDLLQNYFDEQLSLVKSGNIDVLAHLTYAYRYLGRGPYVPGVENFEPQLRSIFEALAQQGLALELNTPGYTAETDMPSPTFGASPVQRVQGGAGDAGF